MAFDGPREFLRFLDEKGVLARVSTPVDIDHEIAAYIRKTSDEQGPALLFERVEGFDMPAVGGLFAARRRAVPHDCLPQYCRRFFARRVGPVRL